ncbi:hypothetical protein [Nostoc sp. PA-18-2419]|uniref:hypothetical protein n=1 Tax=Nostoc sp. PA-18-2419 TaxID=2575443 RepID=UPI00167520DE|nr:hypothetical protein [Nostoc sp. PA-18-2419]
MAYIDVENTTAKPKPSVEPGNLMGKTRCWESPFDDSSPFTEEQNDGKLSRPVLESS